MTVRNLILTVLKDILICSVTLVCACVRGELAGSGTILISVQEARNCRSDITIIKMKCFEFMPIKCDILIECLHSKNDRFVFAFSHIVTFNVYYLKRLRYINY